MSLPAAELPVGGGWLSLSPLPGRAGDLAGDVVGLARWGADLVVSLTEAAEMTTGDLPAALAAAGIGWRHLPVPDYGVPGDAVRSGEAGSPLDEVGALSGKVEIPLGGVEALPGEVKSPSDEAGALPGELGKLPRDMRIPPDEIEALVDELSARLAAGGRIALHCMGGCGRSGMLALRLMVRAGEAPEAALARLRAARPCAIETAAQLAWAVRVAEGAVR